MRPTLLRGRLIAVALAAALAGCATTGDRPRARAPLPPGTLSASELRALFENRTVESVNLSKGRVSLTYYAPDGTVRQRREGRLRTGRWRIRPDGRICLAMEGGREKCRIVVREPDGTYAKYIVKLDGNHRRIIVYRRFLDGNPEGL